MEHIYLSEYYPILETDGNICLTNNGDTFLCYVLELPEVFTLSKSDYVAVHDFWFRTLKHLPANTIIHKQDIFLKETYTGKDLENKTFLQKSTRKHFSGRPFLTHHSLLFIGNTKHNFLKNSDLSNPFKKVISKSVLESESRQNLEFIDAVQKSIEFLNGSKLIKAIPFNPDDIHNYVKNYFNGFDTSKKVDTDLTAKVNTKSKAYNVIGVGDKRVGVFSIHNTKQLPEYVDIYKLDADYSSKKFEIFKGAADDFSFRLPFNHIYNQVIYITDQNKLKSDLNAKKETLYGARGFSAENETAAEDIAEYLKALSKDESRKMVFGHTNLIYYADNDKDFENHTNAVATVFKNLDYIASYPNKELIKDIYVKSLFAYSPGFSKYQFYQTELHIALTGFLNTTSYKNDDEGVVFSDRVFNIPVKRDIRDALKKRIKAWNFMVFAPTGEGKSVLMQHIFRQLNEFGYKVVIFDIGGSFRKLSYLLPEDRSIFISYEPGVGLGINPFYITDITELDTEKLNDISTFVFKLWKPGSELTNELLTPLRKLVEVYFYNTASKHSFPSFYEFIKTNKRDILEKLSIAPEFFDIESFLLYCSEFTAHGQYGFLLNGIEDSSDKIKNKDLIVFEFDKAQGDEIMMAALIHLGSHSIKSLIWENKQVEGVIFFDEMAKFIKNPSIRDNFVFYYQSIRKQVASVGTAFQSPTQLPKGDDIDSALENTQVIYVLYNKQGYQPIVDRFGLSEHEHNILKSITPNLKAKNPYTEFALIIGKEIWVLRLELSKESFYTFQTDGKEYEDIMKIFDQKRKSLPAQKAMETAINEYITQVN